jgi:hypothetical protein
MAPLPGFAELACPLQAAATHQLRRAVMAEGGRITSILPRIRLHVASLQRSSIFTAHGPRGPKAHAPRLACRVSGALPPAPWRASLALFPGPPAPWRASLALSPGPPAPGHSDPPGRVGRAAVGSPRGTARVWVDVGERRTRAGARGAWRVARGKLLCFQALRQPRHTN